MRSDIIAGLKNAIERGATLQQAIQSFINAGYNSAEVQQAAQSLTQGATQITNPQSPQKQPIPNAQPKLLPPITKQQPQTNPTTQQIKKLPTVQNQKSNGSKKTMITIIILVIILLTLIGALVYFLLNKESISQLFT